MGISLEELFPYLPPFAVISPFACGRALGVVPGLALAIASNHVLAAFAGSYYTTA
ncbi:hypothetical protein PPNSA23_16780 [Phyllobacterium phragmitis]|uniref:Uncharacterized protein n=1 Tax=Phyllobacterium phragmitis TaxID=2670329 RepID=A0ABQ0GYJ2_9HYPH